MSAGRHGFRPSTGDEKKLINFYIYCISQHTLLGSHVDSKAAVFEHVVGAEENFVQPRVLHPEF